MTMLPFTFINFVLFQATWFSAALLRDQSSLILLVLIVLHFCLTPTRRQDVWLMMGLVPLGVLIDGLLVSSNILHFASQAIWLPVWMVLLWMHLVVSLNHSLAWLARFPVYLQSLVGALAGAGSYLAAQRLGALNFELSTLASFGLMACIWAWLLPLLFYLLSSVNQRNAIAT